MYLLHNSNSDEHWMAQSRHCPFCTVNFTIYAQVEDTLEDTAYFLLKTNTQDRYVRTT